MDTKKLDFDVAETYLKTGELTSHRRKLGLWNSTSHRSNVEIIGNFRLWCYYDGHTGETTVCITACNNNIPYEIAKIIFDQYLDYNLKRPVFSYSSKSTSDPFESTCSLEFEKAKKAFANIIRRNPRVAYFLPTNAARQIANIENTHLINSEIENLCKENFYTNMTFCEHERVFDVESIILYTTDQLIFCVDLLKSLNEIDSF